MSRLSITVHLPPQTLGARRRLFEPFREAVAERLRRLFPDAETACRASASASVDVALAPDALSGESEEADESRLEAVREEVAAVLEELLVEDDSWWDEEERRKAAAEPEPFSEPFPEAVEARDWSWPEDVSAEDAPVLEPSQDSGMEFSSEPAMDPVQETLMEPARASRPLFAPAESRDASPLLPPASAGAGLDPSASAPPPGGTESLSGAATADAAPDASSPASAALSDPLPEDPLEGGSLCRVGRTWAALFPRYGLSVRLEEREGGRVGLVTRLLPGAAPSTAAWKRLLGGRARAAVWEKAPADVVAAFLDVLRREIGERKAR